MSDEPTPAFPPGGSSAIPDANTIENFIRQYFMFLLVGAAVLYVFWGRMTRKVEDWRSASQSSKARLSDAEQLAALREARLRQQQYVSECTERDAEVRKAKKAQELEQKLALSNEARLRREAEQLGRGPSSAPTLGGDAAQGPMARLPKLPGGSRDTFRPSYQPNGGHTAGYRPSGPACARTKKGG